MGNDAEEMRREPPHPGEFLKRGHSAGARDDHKRPRESVVGQFETNLPMSLHWGAWSTEQAGADSDESY
jgi:hypothetical protein